jgi:decaprenyl-phosphate phosphoribosyltransferase
VPSVTAIVKTLRPHQWVKNLFVAAPLLFARHLLQVEYVLRTAAAVAIFCALSGAVYAFNDVRDVDADRAHPSKCRRPIASGALSVNAALALSAGLAISALAAGFALQPWFAVVAAAYLANNLLYSLALKQVAFVDISMIAAGFLLRVYAGALAIQVPASRWLLLCTGTLALLLGLGKRAHELAWAGRREDKGEAVAAHSTRAALAGYRGAVVRPLLIVLATLTCAAYVGYVFSDHTIAFFGTNKLSYTVPFPMIGIARFLDLSLWHPRAESPTEAMLRDPLFIANMVAWVIAVITIVY